MSVEVYRSATDATESSFRSRAAHVTCQIQVVGAILAPVHSRPSLVCSADRVVGRHSDSAVELIERGPYLDVPIDERMRVGSGSLTAEEIGVAAGMA